MNKLTAKQRRFVSEYMIDLNATQAAIRAGYRAKRAYSTGCENLRKPEIAEALQLAFAEKEQKAGRMALDVLKDIQATTRKALEEGNYQAALRGLELEGKHYGMFKERREVAGDLVIRWQQAGD